MWNDLSMRDRALLIRLAVSLGITNLDDILQSYDLLAIGGPKDNNDGWLPGKKANGGPLNTTKMLNDLSISEKSQMMKAAIRNGITNLNDIKEKYNEFAKGGDTEETYEGGTLPEIEVTPNNVTLFTYRPIIDANYKWTGHSALASPAKTFIEDPNWRGIKIGIDAISINHSPSQKNYNLVTNNCSDATRRALETISGKKINQFLFTTPGDVKDFAEQELGGITHYKNGRYETLIPISQAEREILANKNWYRPDGKIHIKPENRKRFTALKERYNEFAVGGPIVVNKPGDKVSTDQCAKWSNSLLRNNGYLISGNAWNLKDADMLYNGFDNLDKPNEYNIEEIKKYNHAAAENVYNNFDSNTLDKTKPYVVNMFYNDSPAQYDAYKVGKNVTGTHTGVLTYDNDKKKWFVTHNIHGTIYQEPFVQLQSGKGKYGVTAVYAPREDTKWNRIRSMFGFANGGEINKFAEGGPEKYLIDTFFGGPIIQTANKFDGTEQPTQQMDRGNQPLYDGQIGFGFGYNPETFERYYTGFYNPYNNSYNNATWVDENDEYNIGLPAVTIRPSGESMVNRAQEKAAPVVRDVLLGSAALAGGIPALANATSKVPFSALKPGGAFWTNPLTVGTLAAEGINAGVKAVTPYNSVGDVVGSTLEKITGANPNNTWLGPIFTEAFNPGWYVSPTGMINTVGKIGNIVESKLPAIQKALSRNPLPSYAYEDILKSKFYESLVKEYGEDTATEIAKEISTPEVQRFIIGDNPRTAYKAGKKHAKLMQIIKEVENAGGLLAGSGQLAKHGTVNRNGLLHDLDFNIPGDIMTKESPLFDLPGYYSAPRISRRFPFIGKKVMGSNSKGYVNVPHIRLGQYLDMFIKPEMPTENNITNTILEGKRLFGRPKDVADIATFRPYSVDNPMIDITTGEGQWNPTLFDRGIFTEEGYPFVLTVELYPGSKIKVPAMMNYEGQIKTVGGINNIITDDYGFNSFVNKLKNSEFPHWSTIRDKDLLNTALNLLIKEYPFVRKIEGNLDDRLKKISSRWDLDKLLSNLERVPTDYERRKLTGFMEDFPDEQINEDILKMLQLKYTDDNVNDILNRIANKDFDFRIFDHSIDVPSKYSENVDLQIREALANYEYAPYYNGRYTTPLYIMDDFKDLENLIKAYKNGEKLPYDGMYTLEHSFDYLNPEAPQLLKDIAKRIGLVPNLITKNKVPINLEDGMTIYPGYLLKSLMAGNTLEKLLSKTGNININNIKSLANKASNIEKEIINKVLSSDLFANKTTINYNDFKKAVLDQLIEYDLESSDKWANYGMHSVGLTEPETIILSNRNIPKANASTHFKENSLGHFRIAKSKNEPDIMYVLENQSDWGLARYYNNEGKAFNKRKYEEKYLKDVDEDTKKRLLAEARDREKQFLTPEQIFLKNEFERKLILEILLLAALRKMSLVRFPTRDVAAKIEGFDKILEPGVNERIQTAFENGSITYELYELMLNELKTFPQYQEKVLLKYDNFPNLFKKWFKNSDVRSYMDANSNLWYEVDVPQDYLYQEWPYANGGKIHIKPSKRGTFTAAAKKHGKSVQAFASLVLANPSNYSPAMRKKANFARNAAKWHSYGGPIIYKHLGWDKRK